MTYEEWKKRGNSTFQKLEKKRGNSTPKIGKRPVTPIIPVQTPKYCVYMIFKDDWAQKIEKLFFGWGVVGLGIFSKFGVSE